MQCKMHWFLWIFKNGLFLMVSSIRVENNWKINELDDVINGGEAKLLDENFRILYRKQMDEVYFILMFSEFQCPTRLPSSFLPQTQRYSSRHVKALLVLDRHIHLLHKGFCNKPDCSKKVLQKWSTMCLNLKRRND